MISLQIIKDKTKQQGNTYNMAFQLSIPLVVEVCCCVGWSHSEKIIKFILEYNLDLFYILQLSIKRSYILVLYVIRDW